MVKLDRFRDAAPGFADLLPYAALVADGIMLLKDGSLLAAWYYAAPDGESATALERNELSQRLNTVLSRFGSGWMVQGEAIRVEAGPYSARERSAFPDPISEAIDEERRRHFEAGGRHFETRHALILTWRPPDQHSHKVSQQFYADPLAHPLSTADLTLGRFRTSVDEFEQYLSGLFSLRRMVARPAATGGETAAVFDDLLQFVRFCVTGRNQPMRLPEIPMYLDSLLSGQFEHGLDPLIEGRHLSLVTIDGFPGQSRPGILDALDGLPLAYRWSSRFVCLDAEDARRRLERTRRKWSQRVRPFLDQLFQTSGRAVDQDAVLMVSQAESAIAAANSQLVTYGYYTSVIVLVGDNAEATRADAEAVRQAIQAMGFSARIESLNASEAYLGSMPGNWYANIRGPLIHTANLADLLPLSTRWGGSAVSPCPLYPPNSPPLMVVQAGSTPFRLNLHEGDVGHTLIFGPTGSGKSTLLGLIAAQFLRYPGAQIFAFDKGRSMLGLTLGVGGDHYEPGSDAGLSFAPLSDLTGAADRAWAAGWLEILIALQGVVVTPDHRSAIIRQIELMSGQTHRSLSDFAAGVQSAEIKGALAFYTVDGPLGHLLDAREDRLALGHFQCFEMEELMALGERHLVPVLLYLFRRVERRLSGVPSLIILDEAWLMLGHGLFRGRIREWLKVLRKANCAVVLATQSLSDAQGSGMIDVLQESCPTRIFLANPAAREPGSRRFYEAMGLHDGQIDIVTQSRPKHDYYLVSPSGQRRFDMALGPLALSFVGASSKSDLRRINQLWAEHGTEWARHWLEERGVSIDD